MRGTGSSGEEVVLTDVKILSIKEKKDTENDSAFNVTVVWIPEERSDSSILAVAGVVGKKLFLRM